MSREITDGLLKFVENSPTSFHAVSTMQKELDDCGFIHIYEEKSWNLQRGEKYYVTRNGSSLIAFVIPENMITSFQIMASHSDSPTFKLKSNPEIDVEDHFVKLNVEKYGGMMMAPWFDRPLSLAGRLLAVDDKGQITPHLIKIDRDLVLIPNLAVHMNRKANDGYSYNPQIDMLPLFGGADSKGTLMNILSKEAGVKPDQVLDMDVYLYNRMKGSIWGGKEEFVSSSRLDDLQCVYSSLKAFKSSKNKNHVIVHCVLDNEEVGSLTRQGAASTFLKDTLERIAISMNLSKEEYLRAQACGFMLSADNAHSVHPSHQDKTDQSNRPYINGGVVLKYNANQHYTTDAFSAAVVKSICAQANVPIQTFVNRSDIPGGSTLGNISNGQFSIHTADIGLAQLAMHSPYETAGVCDTEYLVRMASAFYDSDIQIKKDGSCKIVF
ncbi:M18 family aminopeptidase [Blautia liquoris]|uniref:M18 family aminopeptidase n=1 Tax=Blautia liquoris TaxID=2779518 RepID=A0A7M2RJS1_9FIRM|nr:M18 family aminopeptidase [Blautia liquoris]QOV19807.1 M18 family aminopeptidase [Blautia liquoris]